MKCLTYSMSYVSGKGVSARNEVLIHIQYHMCQVYRVVFLVKLTSIQGTGKGVLSCLIVGWK